MKKLTHSGNIVLMGFGVMLIFMSVLVYKAMQQDIQVVGNNYYQEEMDFTNRLHARENTAPYENEIGLKQSANGITLQIPQELASGIQTGKVVFFCTSEQQYDTTVALSNNSSGIFTFNTTGWKKTSYTAKISFTSGNKSYYKEIPLVL